MICRKLFLSHKKMKGLKNLTTKCSSTTTLVLVVHIQVLQEKPLSTYITLFHCGLVAAAVSTELPTEVD